MWSPQQNIAIDMIGKWIREKDRPVFMLGGWAGTGKTTLARKLSETVKGEVYFAAFTGKAAHVLSRAGCPNASTIHRLIYRVKDRCQKRLRDLLSERRELCAEEPRPEHLLAKLDAEIEAEKLNLTRPAFQLNLESPLNGAGLLVLDEYSQIDETMGEDLMSFGCPILALGDPAQLPPIRGKSYFGNKPDYMLTEIHRQAADNPIIQLSAQIRAGRSLAPGRYGESRVVRYGQLDREELRQTILDADQLLVGRNVTRHSSNLRMRQIKGSWDKCGDYPAEGDKLVCLRNNPNNGLMNGQILQVMEDSHLNPNSSYLNLKLKNDEGETGEFNAHPEYFRGETPDIWTRKNADEFDYGFALTVHKAQGSQWDSVTLLDEWYGKDRKSWLYTAVTRAAMKIDIVQM